MVKKSPGMIADDSKGQGSKSDSKLNGLASLINNISKSVKEFLHQIIKIIIILIYFLKKSMLQPKVKENSDNKSAKESGSDLSPSREQKKEFYHAPILSWIFSERIERERANGELSKALDKYNTFLEVLISERDSMEEMLAHKKAELSRTSSILKSKSQKLGFKECSDRESKHIIDPVSTIEFHLCTYPFPIKMMSTVEMINQAMTELSEHHEMVKTCFKDTMDSTKVAEAEFNNLIKDERIKKVMGAL